MTTATQSPDRIQCWHEVRDEAKYRALVESMTASGWTGAPVVVVEQEDTDPIAATGSHRIAAARTVGIDVPTVDLAELLAEHGHDLDALMREYEEAGLDRDDARCEVVVRLNEVLPAEIVEYYGLDAH